MSEIMIAGFGGQGVLAAGVILANAGLMADLCSTWLPSYGATMRGGTANCFVKIDRDEIGSPYIDAADSLIVFNEPSFVKFCSRVKPGGNVFVNSSLVHRENTRSDINAIYVPVTDMALELGNVKSANVLMLGVVLARTRLLSLDAAYASLEDYFSSKSRKVIELNKKALLAGYEWKEV